MEAGAGGLFEEAPTGDGFTLWARPDRHRPWVAILFASTSQACVDGLADDRTHEHGEYHVRPGSTRPRNLDLTRPRRAASPK